MLYQPQFLGADIIIGPDSDTGRGKFTDHSAHLIQDSDRYSVDPPHLRLNMAGGNTEKKDKKQFFIHGSSFTVV
jgi:hypothetical protein